MWAARAQNAKPSPAVTTVVLKSESAIVMTRCPPDFEALPRPSPRPSHRLRELLAARQRAPTYSPPDKPHRPIRRVSHAASIHVGYWFFAAHREVLGPHLVRGERHSVRRHLQSRVDDGYEFFTRRLMAFDTQYSARRTHGRMFWAIRDKPHFGEGRFPMMRAAEGYEYCCGYDED